MTIAVRGKYAAVTATWHNKTTGQKVTVSTSTEKSSYILRHTYDTEEQAIEAAKDKMNELNQGLETVEQTLAVGNRNFFAESPLLLTGFRTGIDGGNWTTTKIEHDFSASGFTTRIDAEISN